MAPAGPSDDVDDARPNSNASPAAAPAPLASTSDIGDVASCDPNSSTSSFETASSGAADAVPTPPKLERQPSFLSYSSSMDDEESETVGGCHNSHPQQMDSALHLCAQPTSFVSCDPETGSLAHAQLHQKNPFDSLLSAFSDGAVSYPASTPMLEDDCDTSDDSPPELIPASDHDGFSSSSRSSLSSLVAAVTPPSSSLPSSFKGEEPILRVNSAPCNIVESQSSPVELSGQTAAQIEDEEDSYHNINTVSPILRCSSKTVSSARPVLVSAPQEEIVAPDQAISGSRPASSFVVKRAGRRKLSKKRFVGRASL